MEGVIGVVTCFAADFVPKNWAACNGQTISISQNQALFAILGTTYGGNGTTTFNLPDLRGRTPVSAGQAPGLSKYDLGQLTGFEFATLTVNNLPPHNHNGSVALQLPANTDDGIDPTANGGYPSRFAGAYATAPTAGVTMLSPTYNAVIAAAGSSQGIDIRSPYLAINYIVCLYGIFPSRN
ncbi:MAG: tail fiber protein [Bacteroidota bacterium]|nr:tail fiber protein [Bacteroidota bacterium]